MTLYKVYFLYSDWQSGIVTIAETRGLKVSKKTFCFSVFCMQSIYFSTHVDVFSFFMFLIQFCSFNMPTDLFASYRFQDVSSDSASAFHFRH